MRSLRAFLYFLVGFGLSTVSLLSFAQLHEWTGSRTSPGSIYGRGPNGLPFNIDTGRYVGIGSGSGGSAKLSGSYSASLGGRGFNIGSSSIVPASRLASAGATLARLSGPASVAMMLAPLIWDEMQQMFLVPVEQEVLEGDRYPAQLRYWYHTSDTFYGLENAAAACSRRAGIAVAAGAPAGLTSRISIANNSSCQLVTTSGGLYMSVSRYSEWVCRYGGGNPDSNKMCKVLSFCAEGFLRDPSGKCVPISPNRPATLSEVEQAVYDELVSRNMGADLARRLVDAGYEPVLLAGADSPSFSGPSSMEGPSSTSTTSGPSGQTTTNTTTNYNITYQGDTVTVTETTTTTTTRPDGQTETTTETKTPAPGQSDNGKKEPTEEQKPFCELYPQASACQELGDTLDEDLGEEERSLGWDLPNDVSAQCPQPRVFTSVTVGKSWELEWGPVCDAAEAVKPVVVAFGLLSAAVFVFGIARARA